MKRHSTQKKNRKLAARAFFSARNRMKIPGERLSLWARLKRILKQWRGES